MEPTEISPDLTQRISALYSQKLISDPIILTPNKSLSPDTFSNKNLKSDLKSPAKLSGFKVFSKFIAEKSKFMKSIVLKYSHKNITVPPTLTHHDKAISLDPCSPKTLPKVANPPKHNNTKNKDIPDRITKSEDTSKLINTNQKPRINTLKKIKSIGTPFNLKHNLHIEIDQLDQVLELLPKDWRNYIESNSKSPKTPPEPPQSLLHKDSVKKERVHALTDSLHTIQKSYSENSPFIADHIQYRYTVSGNKNKTPVGTTEFKTFKERVQAQQLYSLENFMDEPRVSNHESTDTSFERKNSYYPSDHKSYPYPVNIDTLDDQIYSDQTNFLDFDKMYSNSKIKVSLDNTDLDNSKSSPITLVGFPIQKGIRISESHIKNKRSNGIESLSPLSTNGETLKTKGSKHNSRKYTSKGAALYLNTKLVASYQTSLQNSSPNVISNQYSNSEKNLNSKQTNNYIGSTSLKSADSAKTTVSLSSRPSKRYTSFYKTLGSEGQMIDPIQTDRGISTRQNRKYIFGDRFVDEF
ncbi:hypothetical protein BB558_006144 [Smittium angustum]|uniref:CRIB domain-containing protein n=1 Tax=Smittium angustum TaxID=133377 RepID=A0A2U1IYJ7_SMIAN|nr:hypothetical protein BB558_006144 [Smittium angustum]